MEITVTSVFENVQRWGWMYVLTFVVTNTIFLVKIATGNLVALATLFDMKPSWGGMTNFRGSGGRSHESKSKSVGLVPCWRFMSSLKTIPSSLFAFEGQVPVWQAAGFNAFLVVILRCKLKHVLTPTGVAHAFVLGSVLWSVKGWKSWSLCVACFSLAHVLTRNRVRTEEAADIAEKRDVLRGPEYIWGAASAGLVCMVCSVQGISFLGIGQNVYVVAYVTSLATKLADTCASEIGRAYGKRAILSTTLEEVPPGTQGAISLEGSVAAHVGAVLLPAYAYFIYMITGNEAIISSVSAILAAMFESVLGAHIRGRALFGWVTNEVLNAISTTMGATVAITACIIFGR